MTNNFPPPKPIPSVSKYSNLKKLILLTGFLSFLLLFVTSISISEANDFESLLNDLGNKSRSKIKIAVQKLGELGNTDALPALNALKNKHLSVSEEGKLVILNDSETEGVGALDGKKIDITSLKLRKPRINNSVRRHLSTALAKLKLNSKDRAVRLEAAQELLKRSSSSVLALVETSLEKEDNEDIKEVLLLVLAKIHLQGIDKNKRIESINTIKIW